MPVEIPLTRGYVALVDEADAERVLARKWRVQPTKQTNYASTTRKNDENEPSNVYMHRFILGVSVRAAPHIDHIDQNGLNNQRSNLRPATRSQNLANRRIDVAQARNKHGYLGVKFIAAAGLYYGRVTIDKVQFHTKGFRTPLEAAAAYDALAVLHFGEFASLNFPELCAA